MGHKMKVSTAKQPDMHFESRVVHKERERNEQTTHEVGKTGSIRSRSRSRVTSRTHSGVGSPKSHKSKHSHRSLTKSHTSGGGRQSSATGDASEKRCKSSGKSSGKSHSGSHSKLHSRSHSKSHRRSSPHTVRERCYDLQRRRRPQPCTRGPKWQTGKYKRDLCGSGIVPVRFGFMGSRGRLWCKTPLSMYQATIGDLGRRLLCRETIIPRDVKPGPPSNIEEYILPPCRGYYRKYDCLRPCEEEFATVKQGKKVYRDRVERYWEPCMMKEQKHALDINTYAHHNAALGLKVRRYNLEVPCW